jgi:hypothetical protein
MDLLRLKQQARGWHLRCSDAPDNSGMNAAAVSQAEMSREQLAWAKQIYAETAPSRDAAAARAAQVSDVQLEAMRKQTALTDDYAAYQKDTFRPLEQQMVKDASEYDTPERRAAAAGEAMSGVEQQVASQRAASTRNLERSGVAPGSGKSLSLQGGMDLGAAKLKAGAASTAVKQVETIGAAKKADAVSIGRGLAGNQATSASLALAQGNSSSGQLASVGGINAQGAALMNSGFAGAQSGMAGAANTYGNIANINARANDGSSGLWGALGAVGGAFVGGPMGAQMGAAIGRSF